MTDNFQTAQSPLIQAGCTIHIISQNILNPELKLIFIFNPDCPLDRYLVIPCHPRESGGQAGIQLIKNPRAAGQYRGFVRCAECITSWIPACAGMTGLMENLG